MGKLVVLKLAEGSFEEGFSVTLQIGDENARPSVEIIGKLPPNPNIPDDYHRWQSIYRHLRLESRPIGIPKRKKDAPSLEDCQQVTEEFKLGFNGWLASDLFRPIREKWLEKLTPLDDIRILIQTKDLRLQKLPWHLWDLLERYPKAEIALSAPSYEQVKKAQITGEKVKILAILGNSEGIDIQVDREILESLPNADITFLVEPERRQITDQLWEQHWQILFFAGHSATQSNETGKIYINETESLTISQLRYALKKGVEGGLQLAIFNSCDGLGLAREFADLNIPQIIVMREPVPDQVAQEFLKYFLQAFARGDSLYLSVREARERLQGLESQYPCATWLPIICQNPAEVPFSWEDLCINARMLSSYIADTTHSRRIPKPVGFSIIVMASIAITTVLMGVRYLGFLQTLELKAFDQLIQLRPPEKPDSRLLVVSITEEDVRAQQSENPRGSLSDKSLNKLLEKLEVHKPAAIGLDIYRDYAIDKNYPGLAKRMKTSGLVGVCKVSNPQKGRFGVAPPPEIDSANLGFSDIILDTDNVVRRHYLALTPPPSSACNASYALSVQLALRYLYGKGIELKFSQEGVWQLGKLEFKPLETNAGGYQGIDALGHQILLNYRSSPSPEAIVPQISLGEVLQGKLNPAAVKDKIVIVGTIAESFRDYSLTPFTVQGKSQNIPGVILQAQMTSQLLSAALDGRPLLSYWSFGGETIWVWGWSVVGGLVAWCFRKPSYLVVAIGIVSIALYGTSFILLISLSYWVPLVPAFIAFGSSNIIVNSYFNSLSKISSEQ